MNSGLPSSLRCAVLGAAAAFFPALAPAADATMIDAAKVRWSDAPPSLPRGARLAVLHGDPSKPGPFVIRIKVPPRYRIPAHWHSTDEALTVVSGTFYLGLGDKLDMKNAYALKAGGFHFLPAKTNHYAYTTTPAVVQVQAEGPFDLTYVDPKDNPDQSAPKP